MDNKAAMWHGGGLAVFFFVIYSAYALAFDFGTTLINEGHADAGQVINVRSFITFDIHECQLLTLSLGLPRYLDRFLQSGSDGSRNAGYVQAALLTVCLLT